MRTAETLARASEPAILNAVGDVAALKDGAMTMAGCDDATYDAGGQRFITVVPHYVHHHTYQRMPVLLRVYVPVFAFSELR